MTTETKTKQNSKQSAPEDGKAGRGGSRTTRPIVDRAFDLWEKAQAAKQSIGTSQAKLNALTAKMTEAQVGELRGKIGKAQEAQTQAKQVVTL